MPGTAKFEISYDYRYNFSKLCILNKYRIYIMYIISMTEILPEFHPFGVIILYISPVITCKYTGIEKSLKFYM
jgi:hypothetical protein